MSVIRFPLALLRCQLGGFLYIPAERSIQITPLKRPWFRSVKWAKSFRKLAVNGTWESSAALQPDCQPNKISGNLKSFRFASNARLRNAAANTPAAMHGESGPAVGIVQQAFIDLGLAMARSTKRLGSRTAFSVERPRAGFGNSRHGPGSNAIRHCRSAVGTENRKQAECSDSR